MAQNDYFVIVYRVLKHLYDCLKAGNQPEIAYLAASTYNIPDSYWIYIVISLINEGYIKGITMTSTKDGEELDIRETQRVKYTLANILSGTWQIADEKNCPILGGEATFSFGEAIKYLKRGMKVARKGWNGKKQYIQLATGISYKAADGEIVNCEHNAIGNMAVAFIGTSGVQMGWLASQADMLADDWVFAE